MVDVRDDPELDKIEKKLDKARKMYFIEQSIEFLSGIILV